VERLKESRRHSLLPSNRQYTMEIVNKPLVMASEIAGLEPLNGYIKQENYVVRVRFPYVAPIERQPRFIERTYLLPCSRHRLTFYMRIPPG